MVNCPICKFKLQEIDGGRFDGKTFRCSNDGDFGVTRTVLATSALMESGVSRWEMALKKAKLRRAKPHPCIMTHDF